jgi:hypothetical protein
MAATWTQAAFVALFAVGMSCAAGGPDRLTAWGPDKTEPLPPRGNREMWHPVVLVTIDGARWQEIFEGTDPKLADGPRRASREIVPHLDRMARERGAAIGAPGRGTIRATGPNFVSLPGYTEILSGRAPHGCPDNSCGRATLPTVLDEAYAAGGTVAAFTSWDRLERAATAWPGRFVVSSGRRNDPAISPKPGAGNYRPDRVTAEVALRHLVVERPDVLYVGLGDADEQAHRSNYRGYLEALTHADAFVGRVLEVLGRMGGRGERTHVIVTADHGRAHDFRNHGQMAPESARVWLVASGPTIAARGRVASPADRRLADVAPTLRVVLGLPADRSANAGRPLAELFAM